MFFRIILFVTKWKVFFILLNKKVKNEFQVKGFEKVKVTCHSRNMLLKWIIYY